MQYMAIQQEAEPSKATNANENPINGRKIQLKNQYQLYQYSTIQYRYSYTSLGTKPPPPKKKI